MNIRKTAPEGPFRHGLNAVDPRRDVLYLPEKRPGFVAWATAFDYGNGSVGLSFKETLKAKNEAFLPPRLEMGEAVGAPVSYCSIECGSEDELCYRVYLRSDDSGKSFYETGRCQLEEGSFCNIGFPDGRIVGLDVPRINEDRTGWCEGIHLRESLDGGSTWQPRGVLLPGTAPYLWRARRLRDGTVVVMACLYGTPWGIGKERNTRNTMLPGETYINKIQTFFLTSKNGIDYTGPHYILPGVGAHEYDFVEKSDGSLLFIAGDVQATPVARQLVTRQGDSFINGTLFGIRRGSPPDPAANPQGGFVPESMVMLSDGLIVGSRRGKPYSCSNDDGESWYETDGLPPSLYQPYMLLLPDGTVANFGHFGGDNAFGEVDMYVGADFFRIDNKLPAPTRLALERCLSDDRSHYENRYRAALTAGGKPLPGKRLLFRMKPVWNPDGSVNTAPQEEAPVTHEAVTDSGGVAVVHAAEFDGIPDIHHYYYVDVIFRPEEGEDCAPCDGPTMCCSSLTPYRKNLFPHPAYFVNGTLYLSPDFLKSHPDAVKTILAQTTEDGARFTKRGADPALTQSLLEARVLQRGADGTLCWLESVHCKKPLEDVRQMSAGDWYE